MVGSEVQLGSPAFAGASYHPRAQRGGLGNRVITASSIRHYYFHGWAGGPEAAQVVEQTADVAAFSVGGTTHAHGRRGDAGGHSGRKGGQAGAAVANEDVIGGIDRVGI